MSATPIIEVRHASKTYSGTCVLSDVSFQLFAGEVHALVGENGAGKSTLIKIIAGVVTPDEGVEILFDGKPVQKLTPKKAIELGVSVIYQEISLFPNLSVAENICKGMYQDAVVDFRKMRKTAQDALDLMGIQMDLRQRLSDISLGKRQLVAIARAITFHARVIVMDEPTAALSSSEVQMLYQIIEKLRAQGVGIIYISHKLDEVFRVADRISVLRDGQLVACDSASAFDEQKLVSLMVGRELRFLPMHSQHIEPENILFESRGLTCEPWFRDISFSVRAGEIVGLTGLVGAGRSEWAQAVFGMKMPQAGQVLIRGQVVSPRSASEAIAQGICYLPEDRRAQGLFQGNPMYKNISVVALQKVLKNRLLNRSREISATSDYIDKISIRPNEPTINVENLSGGNQQKALIARWLYADPKVLIVDEPTSGVDVGAKLEIHRLLRQLASQGVCVILISSDLPEVIALSDRILVMRRGNLVAEVEAADATQEAILAKGLMG